MRSSPDLRPVTDPDRQELGRAGIMTDQPRDNVRSVLEDGLCIACGTCVGLCPREALPHRWDLDKGLLIEVDEERCTMCGICARACPAREVDLPALTKSFLGKLSWRSRGPLEPSLLAPTSGGEVAPSPRELRLWAEREEADFMGLSRRVFAGWASDDSLRWRGSSGGLATAILLGALETGSVDGVVVTRMDPHHPLRSESYIAVDRQGILDAVGSKYTIASPNLLLRELMKREGRFAVVGLPCHIEGLRKAQIAVPKLRRRVVLALGLFCGTTCTPRGTVVGIRRAGVEPKDVTEIAYRGDGWPGSFRLTLSSGVVKEIPYPDYFDPWFAAHIPPRCLVCPDGTNELADLAVGDAWVERYAPGRGNGASFVIVRSPSAVRLLEEIQPGWVHLEQTTAVEIERAQAETYAVNRQGVRGNLWLRSRSGRAIPRFPGRTVSDQRSERRAAVVAALRNGAYRLAARVLYPAGDVEGSVVAGAPDTVSRGAPMPKPSSRESAHVIADGAVAGGVRLDHPDACTACHSCELACSYHHLRIFQPSRSSVWVERDPDNGVVVRGIQVEAGGERLPCDGCRGEDGRQCDAFCNRPAVRSVLTERLQRDDRRQASPALTEGTDDGVS
jgi:coenzyme F420 hydrogenase subunit beta